MKPSFESVNASVNSTFVVRKFSRKNFFSPFHFHPELELTYILNGYGQRYVGSHTDRYAPGDLVLLGANLPHCWKNGSPEKEKSVSIVVHFKNDFLGADFFDNPGMYDTYRLLKKSNSGLQFTGDNLHIKSKMIDLSAETSALKKVIIFLEILHELSCRKDFKILNKKDYYSSLSQNDMQRISKVIGYVVENFQNSMSLAEAASIAHMTTHSFCKYFKKITRKTFIEAVTDYRLDFAVKQLTLTDKPIAEIGFDSGFKDVSNFHKTFKRRMAVSPLTYRNLFLENISQ